jgi:hypothetical protein
MFAVACPVVVERRKRSESVDRERTEIEINVYKKE